MAEHFGLLGFVRMPFGLLTAAQTLHRFVREAEQGLQNMYMHLDDR